MNNEVHQLSRRALLSLAGKSFGAAMLCGADWAALAQPATGGAPAGSLLKRRIKTRTFNAHMHITGLSRSLAPNLVKTEPKPFDPKMTITDEERQEAITYWTRFKHGVLEWDSKEQEDFYVKKYTHHRRRPLRETFEDRAERFLKQMDEAGIDTSILLLLDFMRPLAAAGAEGDTKGERIEPMLQATQELVKKYRGQKGYQVQRKRTGHVLLVERAELSGLERRLKVPDSRGFSTNRRENLL